MGGVEVISYLCISSHMTRTEAITVILERKVALWSVIVTGNFSGWGLQWYASRQVADITENLQATFGIMTISQARSTEVLFQLSWCLLDRNKCFAETRCFIIQGTRESSKRKMLQGLQKRKQEPTPSVGHKEKITLKSTLKTKTYTVLINPKSHVMNSVLTLWRRNFLLNFSTPCI